jgi:hypothetical protein
MWNKTWRVLLSQAVNPWAVLMKSLTKMSNRLRGCFFHVRGRMFPGTDVYSAADWAGNKLVIAGGVAVLASSTVAYGLPH